MTQTVGSCATTFSGTDYENGSKIGTYQVTSEDPCEASDGIMKAVKNWSRHEIQMFKTSIWVIVFFSFCWIPYGILVLMQDLAPIELKKVRFSFCPRQRLLFALFWMLPRAIEKLKRFKTSEFGATLCQSCIEKVGYIVLMI